MYARGGFLRKSFDAFNQFGEPVEDHVGEIATVIQDHVERLAVLAKEQCLLDTPVKFFFSHAFPGINGNTCSCNSRSSMVLRRENVARRPAYRCAQFDEGFDKYCG